MPASAAPSPRRPSPSTQLAPALFDLTSLQREANGRFGFSAKTTLSIAQALYEKHKALTYPRTDSRALPEDYIGTVAKTMEALEDLPAMAPFARQVSANGWVKPNKRIFDNTKVSDHFAIIPTLQTPKHLTDAEQRIYDMVVRRFLAVFFPPAEYLLTTRITKVKVHSFKTEGRVLVNPGWLAIYGREEGGTGAAGKSDATLVAVGKGEDALARAVEILALTTRPPARYNEGTLLSAMEGAGKLVEDDELREAMAEKGLGTPATRASIIEGLIAENYLVREGRELVPTTKAFQLLTLLRGLGVQELTMPELTGEWEYKLSQMERGRLDRAAFMDEIAEVTRRIVERAKNYQSDTVPGDYATLRTPCPKCGAVVQENYKRFACTQCDFSISKHPGGRTFQLEEVEQLLTERTLGPLQGFRSRLGRPFAAILKITAEIQAGVRLRPEPCRRGRQRRTGRLLRATSARPLPQVCRQRVRARVVVRVREIGGTGAQLRLPLGQDHPAAGDRHRSDATAAHRRPHRAADRFRVLAHPAQVQGVPGAGRGRQDRLRVRTAPAEAGGQGGTACTGWSKSRRGGRCAAGRERFGRFGRRRHQQGCPERQPFRRRARIGRGNVTGCGQESAREEARRQESGRDEDPRDQGPREVRYEVRGEEGAREEAGGEETVDPEIRGRLAGTLVSLPWNCCTRIGCSSTDP